MEVSMEVVTHIHRLTAPPTLEHMMVQQRMLPNKMLIEMSNYTGQQYQIKNQISRGYAKTHTINNETEYLGYVNINIPKQMK